MELITTKFGFQSTADEVVREVSLVGKRIVITGAASGIGLETARSLARTGAELTLAVRNVAAGRKVAETITALTGNSQIHVVPLDLNDRASVTAFGADWHGPLHVLVNNAGIVAIPELQRSAGGCEQQFATNYLGHFALTLSLHAALAAADDARIITVSSSVHLLSPVVFDDIHFDFRPYDPWLAYGQSKTANILFAVGATARWARDGISANALNPGAIATDLQRYVDGRLATPLELQKTPQQGAATSVLLASSPALAGVSGRYFEDCNEAPTVSHRPENYQGVACYALDPENAGRLWEESLQLLAR